MGTDLEERMLKVERDNAIHGQQNITHRNELNELFILFRKHMEKEEDQRDEVITLIADLNNSLAKQKSFWAGITFATSIIWVIGFAAWQYFTKK